MWVIFPKVTRNACLATVTTVLGLRLLLCSWKAGAARPGTRSVSEARRMV